MATVNTGMYTMADWAGKLPCDCANKIVINAVSTTNHILEDMLVAEGNLPTGHKYERVTSLPHGTWRAINEGVDPTKGQEETVTDICGELMGLSQVDESLCELGDGPSIRAAKDSLFTDGMGQDIADALFYGNVATNPRQFTGLTPRYNALTNGQVVGGGGTTALTSIWLVGWGLRGCHGFYPKGSPSVGLDQEDLGKQLVNDANSKPRPVYTTKFKWKLGLAVTDARYVVRIANIDTSALTYNAGSGAKLVDLMVQAEELIPNLDGSTRLCWYANRTIRSFLRRQIPNTNNVRIETAEVGGKRITTFNEIPFRRCDALLNTETQVS